MNRPSERRIPLFWILQVAGWSAFWVAMALSRSGRYSLEYMAATKGILAALGFLVTLGMWPAYRALWTRGAGLGWILVGSLGISYVGALVWTVASNFLVLRLYLGEQIPAAGTATLFNGTVYHAFALLAWSLLYFGIRYHDALQSEREQRLRAQALAHEAQLKALRFQLNPHFLFNALNAISTLVLEERAREASAMISRLSDFLRRTLESDGAAEVPLADEIEFARRYLEIEQIRFGDRLRVTWSVEAETLGIRVPALILQPLVENAVKHAVSPREEGGCIRLEAARERKTLLLTIRDDGPGLDLQAGLGIGLENTRRRMEQLYGDEGALIVQTGEEGFTVMLRIPARPRRSSPQAMSEPA